MSYIRKQPVVVKLYKVRWFVFWRINSTIYNAQSGEKCNSSEWAKHVGNNFWRGSGPTTLILYLVQQLHLQVPESTDSFYGIVYGNVLDIVHLRIVTVTTVN